METMASRADMALMELSLTESHPMVGMETSPTADMETEASTQGMETKASTLDMEANHMPTSSLMRTTAMACRDTADLVMALSLPMVAKVTLLTGMPTTSTEMPSKSPTVTATGMETRVSTLVMEATPTILGMATRDSTPDMATRVATTLGMEETPTTLATTPDMATRASTLVRTLVMETVGTTPDMAASPTTMGTVTKGTIRDREATPSTPMALRATVTQAIPALTPPLKRPPTDQTRATEAALRVTATLATPPLTPTLKSPLTDLTRAMVTRDMEAFQLPKPKSTALPSRTLTARAHGAMITRSMSIMKKRRRL